MTAETEPLEDVSYRIKSMLEQCLTVSADIAATTLTDEPDKGVLDAVSAAYQGKPNPAFTDLYLAIAHGLHEAAENARQRGHTAEKMHILAQDFLMRAMHGYGPAMAHAAGIGGDQKKH